MPGRDPVAVVGAVDAGWRICDDRRGAPPHRGRRHRRASLGGAGVKGIVIGIAATAIAFAILVHVLSHTMVSFEGGVVELVILSIVFGLVNAFIKPVVSILSFPISMMTLGLFGFVINAGLLLVVAYVADKYANIAFSVGGFPAHGITADTIVGAVVASIALGIISTIVGLVVHD
jgi:putative membrane protein